MTASKSDLSVQYIHNVYSMDKTKAAPIAGKPRPAAAKVAPKSRTDAAIKPDAKPAKSDT